MRATIARKKYLELKILYQVKNICSFIKQDFLSKRTMRQKKQPYINKTVVLELYCTPSHRSPQPLYPSCFEKLAGRALAKALGAMNCTGKKV